MNDLYANVKVRVELYRSEKGKERKGKIGKASDE